MNWFQHREDVEEWLAPLGYDDFWIEVAAYEPAIEPKDSCDAQIASGSIDAATVLTALKGLTVIDLVQRYGLKRRPIEMPWISMH